VAAEIEKDLIGTCLSIARLMEERQKRLEELAAAVAGDYLIRTILTDKGLDRVTRDDILNSVILPGYSQLQLLAVFNKDASIRAISTKAEALQPMLTHHPTVGRSIEGREAMGYIPHEGSLFQIAALPVFLGIYVRELIGVVAVGMPWSMQDLNSVRELSHAEIAFFDTTGILLSSGPPFAAKPGDKVSAVVWSHLAALPSDLPSVLQAGSQDFLVVKIGTPDVASPAYMVARSLDQQLEILNRVRNWLLQLGIGGVLIGCVISVLLAVGISRPIHTLQSAFRRVAQGNFELPVTVRSRDEFAELATAFNRMQQDLSERAEMKHALLMAEEVQRNLLPIGPPQVEHLDIAGASLYCRAIGGDYYDFFEGPQGFGKIRIVLGDACGHGIESALLMASSRALLRSRALQPGPIEEVIGDVNRELSRDMKDTGRFITLFMAEIDTRKRELRWVRAGHDPAILYHPATGTFEKLAGPGRAMGIDAGQFYTAQSKGDLADGQVLLIGSDGIWEARNASGEIFGKDRLYGLLRHHGRNSAQAIVDSVLAQLKQFKGVSDFEDDVTLVVVRLMAG
jgi:serine phosphatase RsbU (regulator of sigma subunit)